MQPKQNSPFLEKITGSAIPLLSDGAMGTMLHQHGIRIGSCFDELNLSKPAVVADIHSQYIQAGSDIIQTNTFSANAFKLAGFGLEDRVNDINSAGVQLARKVVDASFKSVFVAGDVGPLGVRLAPFGRVQPEQARSAFRQQIKALAGAGADLVLLETFNDLYEVNEAIQAARDVCDLPVVASVTFTRDDRTILGDSPAKAARYLMESGADIIGINCSGGPAQIWRVLRAMQKTLVENGPPDVRPLLSGMPNAGWPEQTGGRIMYPANPEYFGEYSVALCEAGAKLVGGCCGTTPAHIKAMRTSMDTTPAGCGPPISELSMPSELEIASIPDETESRMASGFQKGFFMIAVEMNPPRGLSAHKIIAGASLLSEAGADVINVSDSPMARMRMSPWAVCEIVQNQVGIETTLHFPTRGRNLLRVQGDLLAAHALGIRNVFVVMGDPTAIGDYPDAMDNYDLVPSGLIKLIKQNFNIGVDHAGAELGQPTRFFVGCALNLDPKDINREIRNLRRKLENGADFILTQPIYDPALAESFMQRYSNEFGELDIPVMAGVLPLFSTRHAAFLHNEVPGITIPDLIHTRLQEAGEEAPKEGVRIALELVKEIQPWAKGIYLMPAFNRYDLAADIIENIRTR